MKTARILGTPASSLNFSAPSISAVTRLKVKGCTYSAKTYQHRTAEESSHASHGDDTLQQSGASPFVFDPQVRPFQALNTRLLIEKLTAEQCCKGLLTIPKGSCTSVVSKIVCRA